MSGNPELSWKESAYVCRKSNNSLLFSCSTADIVFIVKDKPHPIFKRDNDNLIYTASVPLGKVIYVLNIPVCF
jgi:DnaJ-class molecular chaperone